MPETNPSKLPAGVFLEVHRTQVPQRYVLSLPFQPTAVHLLCVIIFKELQAVSNRRSHSNLTCSASSYLPPVVGTVFVLHEEITRKDTKIKLFDACVKSVLLYGCETWLVTKGIQRKIQTFVNRRLRYILRIWWPNIISNKDLWKVTIYRVC